MGITQVEANGLCSDWLHRAAQRQSAVSALVLKDGSFDYASLHSLTAQLCQQLRAQGLKSGATLVVESRSARLLAFLLHAALFADFVLLPLDPHLPDGQRKHLLERVRADLILSEDDVVRLNHVIEDMTAASPPVQSGQPESVCTVKSPAAPDRPRLLLATSGSSGFPRLVSLSDSNLQASVQAANERLKPARVQALYCTRASMRQALWMICTITRSAISHWSRRCWRSCWILPDNRREVCRWYLSAVRRSTLRWRPGRWQRVGRCG